MSQIKQVFLIYPSLIFAVCHRREATPFLLVCLIRSHVAVTFDDSDITYH